MVADKKLRFQKFEYNSRTGKQNKTDKELIDQHNEEVLLIVQALKENHLEEGDDIKTLELRPRPDIIEVDWQERKIIAIEVSRNPQDWKRKKYEGTEWDRIELIRFQIGKKRKIYTSRYLKYRRIV